jgi:hypothetical protein
MTTRQELDNIYTILDRYIEALDQLTSIVAHQNEHTHKLEELARNIFKKVYPDNTEDII